MAMKHIQYNYQIMRYCLMIGLIAAILSFSLMALKGSGYSHIIQNILFDMITVTAFPMLLWLFKVNEQVIKGIVLAHAAFLVIFSLWLYSLTYPESMLWIHYIFSLLGGITGGIISVSYVSANRTHFNQLIAFSLTILGMFLVLISMIIPIFL